MRNNYSDKSDGAGKRGDGSGNYRSDNDDNNSQFFNIQPATRGVFFSQ